MTHAQPDQQTAFAKAVALRDRRKAIRIAREDPSVHQLKLPSCHGYERALHAAVRLKSVRLAEVLLDQGMDVDIPYGGGYTPLFLAPELYSRLSVVQLLVERGADVHFGDDGTLWSAIWQASFYCTGIAHTWQFKTGQHRPGVAAFLRARGAMHGAEVGGKKKTSRPRKKASKVKKKKEEE